jgi:hypothetical protein
MFLSTVLDASKGRILEGGKTVPLGLIGLVTVVYEESFDRAMETVPKAREIVGDKLYGVWCDGHKEQDLAEIDAVLRKLTDFEELAVRLEDDSTLAWAWKRQEEDLLRGFGVHLVSGALCFDPRFFAPEEIREAMHKMEQRYWSKPWSISRYLLVPASLNLIACIRETVDEVMSAERVAELVTLLKVLGQSSLTSQDEQTRSVVLALQAGIAELVEVEPVSRSQVIQSLFLQEVIESLGEVDELGSHWVRFIQQASNSRLIRGMHLADA